MKTIAIKLTDQQEHFLKMFAANHYPGAAENLATYKPIHVVQTQRVRVVDPNYDTPDTIKYIVPDFDNEGYDSAEEMIQAFYKYEHCPIRIISFDEAQEQDEFTDINGEGQILLDEQDYLDTYGITKDKYCKVYTENYYEPVAYFFILKEAKQYIEYQKHNLCNPRTFTYGPGYANHGDFEHFWDLLFSIGKMLNEEGGGKADEAS